MDINFYSFLSKFSDSPYFFLGNKIISYLQFKIEVDKKALCLKKKGIIKSDFVGLKIKDPFDFFVTLLALWKLKAIAVPFSEKMPTENIYDWSEDIPFSPHS